MRVSCGKPFRIWPDGMSCWRSTRQRADHGTQTFRNGETAQENALGRTSWHVLLATGPRGSFAGIHLASIG